MDPNATTPNAINTDAINPDAHTSGPAAPSLGASEATVVVAIDESLSSRAALAWAARYARSVGADLRAVHVMRYDYGSPVAWAPGLLGAPHTMSEAALELARTSVREMFAEVAPEPGWTLEFLEGSPGQQIVQSAYGARILVIGTREHRGLERLLVGSVSHYCLNHAAGPVVAVPAPGTSPLPPAPVGAGAGVVDGALL